jgi:hypothetical protein
MIFEHHYEHHHQHNNVIQWRHSMAVAPSDFFEIRERGAPTDSRRAESTTESSKNFSRLESAQQS